MIERIAFCVLCILIIACTGIGAVPFIGGLIAFVALLIAAAITFPYHR